MQIDSPAIAPPVVRMSPDGTRTFSRAVKTGERCQVLSIDGHLLFDFNRSADGGFVTDNLILLNLVPLENITSFVVIDTITGSQSVQPSTDDSIQQETWERQFPEWWWGHFYRPEVWLTIIFGSLWLWRVAKWVRCNGCRGSGHC